MVITNKITFIFKTSAAFAVGSVIRVDHVITGIKKKPVSVAIGPIGTPIAMQIHDQPFNRISIRKGVYCMYPYVLFRFKPTLIVFKAVFIDIVCIQYPEIKDDLFLNSKKVATNTYVDQ